MPQPLQKLSALLRKLDGCAFHRYQTLAGQRFGHKDFHFLFNHVQGSTGAFPASVVHLFLSRTFLRLPDHGLVNADRRLACADFLWRAFSSAVEHRSRRNRGARGSGSFQLAALPPQVLETNLVSFRPDDIRLAFHISLPGTIDNQIMGHPADQMLTAELPAIALAVKQTVAGKAKLKIHCDRVEDMLALQRQLSDHGLVAFVADGALLPRQSGVSEDPMDRGAKRFITPGDLAIDLDAPNAGRIRGLGIQQGVSVVIGGGFHGKSTLINALAKAVYPHIPEDGREGVASHPETAMVCSEPGRAINGVDISGFMAPMPDRRKNPGHFWTQNASGSTSQAAAIAEAVTSGAKLLLIDEDSSATNFLIRDRQMRRLVPHDPVTPLLDRVRELHQRFGVSTLLVVGGSSEYIGVADHIIAMHDYLPHSMTNQICQLTFDEPVEPEKALTLSDKRRLSPDNFDPAFQAHRLGKTVAVRIKPLRLHETLLEYGNQQLDMTHLKALVDVRQVLAIGYALLLARRRFRDKALSPTDLATALDRVIDAEGLDVLCHTAPYPLFLARPRRLELAGAINRLRNLKLDAPSQ